MKIVKPKGIIMNSLLKKIATTVLIVGSVVLVPLAGVSAQTQVQTQADAAQSTLPAHTSSIADAICKGVLSTTTGTVTPGTTLSSCQESGTDSFSFLIKRIINLFSVVVGAASVIMIIIGGFKYIISGGDSSGVSGAKNTILYAVVGLVIVLFAQVIVRFVLTNVIPK